MPSSSRQVKKLLYQFLRRQLILSNGDRGEVFQLRPRQVFRRGSLPDLALHSIAEQDVRYLILLHFSNFVSVYFADPQGTIVNVKNFDRKRDQHTLEELPRLARRILEYPKPAKVPSKHERLLRKTETLQQQFRAKIYAIEQLVGVRLPSRKIPGIALTAQEQDGVIRIPVQLRTDAQLDHFFTTETFRLFIPGVFQLHADLLARFLTYIFVDDPTEGFRFLKQLFKIPKDIVRHLSTETFAWKQIRPFIALLRLWARYEDRIFPTDAFNRFFIQMLTELTRDPTKNHMEIVATVSEVLFQSEEDTRDLLRLTCFLVLSNNQALIQEYCSHEIFQSTDDVARFCHAMLTLRFRQLYPAKSKIIGQYLGPKLTRLFQRAFEQLKKWILQVEKGRSQLTLVNQSDLELRTLTLRYPSSAPEEVLVTMPHIDPDSMTDIPLDQELGPARLIVEFTDNFSNNYRVLV